MSVSIWRFAVALHRRGGRGLRIYDPIRLSHVLDFLCSAASRKLPVTHDALSTFATPPLIFTYQGRKSALRQAAPKRDTLAFNKYHCHQQKRTHGAVSRE